MTQNSENSAEIKRVKLNNFHWQTEFEKYAKGSLRMRLKNWYEL
jgi:hypothetical protein